jgi:hypothetical protein
MINNTDTTKKNPTGVNPLASETGIHRKTVNAVLPDINPDVD